MAFCKQTIVLQSFFVFVYWTVKLYLPKFARRIPAFTSPYFLTRQTILVVGLEEFAEEACVDLVHNVAQESNDSIN